MFYVWPFSLIFISELSLEVRRSEKLHILLKVIISVANHMGSGVIQE